MRDSKINLLEKLRCEIPFQAKTSTPCKFVPNEGYWNLPSDVEEKTI